MRFRFSLASHPLAPVRTRARTHARTWDFSPLLYRMIFHPSSFGSGRFVPRDASVTRYFLEIPQENLFWSSFSPAKLGSIVGSSWPHWIETLVKEVIVAGRRGRLVQLFLLRLCRRRFASVSLLSSISSGRISRGKPRRELNRYHLFAISPKRRGSEAVEQSN